MGQAKLRGTFEQRKTAAILSKAEQEQKRFKHTLKVSMTYLYLGGLMMVNLELDGRLNKLNEETRKYSFDLWRQHFKEVN